MDTSPVTNKTLGIANSYGSEKFRDVRKRANLEYKIRKTKRNRQVKLPKFKVDDEFVAANGGYGRNKHYHFVKVIDFKGSSISVFSYFCILLKTTDRTMLDRIGRLIMVDQEGGLWMNLTNARVSREGIKWL